jgi:hypothetical protein
MQTKVRQARTIELDLPFHPYSIADLQIRRGMVCDGDDRPGSFVSSAQATHVETDAA